jgi:hypothetical protein
LRTTIAGVSNVQRLAEFDILAGAQLVTFAQSHLAELRAGNRIRVVYLLADRGRTLELELRPHLTGTDGRISLDVVAASPLLRPFVTAAKLWFAVDGRFVAMSGQITPQLGTAENRDALLADMTVRTVSGATVLTSNCHI